MRCTGLDQPRGQGPRDDAARARPRGRAAAPGELSAGGMAKSRIAARDRTILPRLRDRIFQQNPSSSRSPFAEPCSPPQRSGHTSRRSRIGHPQSFPLGGRFLSAAGRMSAASMTNASGAFLSARCSPIRATPTSIPGMISLSLGPKLPGVILKLTESIHRPSFKFAAFANRSRSSL